MKVFLFRLYRQMRGRVNQALMLGSLYVSQAVADLPSVEQPTSGGGGGTYNMVLGYLKMGGVLLGLVVCTGAFLAVAHAVITAFHDIRRGKGSWTEFLLYLVVGVVLILLVIYLATKAADVL